MFVLTQLPTFPQLLNSSPGKAIRGCAPKVLAEPGPQLVWFWFWTGSGLVAAWLPRVTGGRSPVLPSHFWAASLDWLSLFFIIMRKSMPTEEEVIVDISPRTPSTESSVETSPGINWPTMRIFIPRRFSWFIILVLSLAISLGLFLQLSTLKYSYKTYQLTMA